MATLSCNAFSRSAGQASLPSPSCCSSSSSSRVGSFPQRTSIRNASEHFCSLCGNGSTPQLRHFRRSRANHQFAAPLSHNASRDGSAVKFSHPQIRARHGGHWRVGSIGRFSRGIEGLMGAGLCVQRSKRWVIRAAYISPPGAPAEAGYYRGSETEEDVLRRLQEDLEPPEREDLINARLVRRLVFEEKKSLCIVFASLVAGTCCTLSMPIFSGMRLNFQ